MTRTSTLPAAPGKDAGRTRRGRYSTLVQRLLLLACLLPAGLWAADPPAAADVDLERLYQAASRGDAHAQFQLFKAYRLGVGVERSVADAIHWLHAAGNSGHPEAQYWLGFISFTGQGIERDVEGGMAWYRKSADQGFVPAQVALGDVYNGWRYRFYPSDPAQAVTWYSRAAAQGDLQSMFIVGCKHYFGLGLPVDTPAGLSWFQQAAAAGDDTATAYLSLGNLSELKQFCERIERL